MALYEAVLQYFRGDVKRFKNIDINKDSLIEIGKKWKTDVTIEEKMVMGFPQVVINVAGDEEAALRDCVREIIGLYGKPGLPKLVFRGSRKRGKYVVKSVVQELRL